MSDLISRQDVLDLANSKDDSYTVADFIEDVECLPSAKNTGLYCTMAGRECFTQGKEIAWCMTCPHISEEDRGLVKKAVSAEKTGKWTKKDYIRGIMYCSVCGGNINTVNTPYCPWCGARMVGDTE